LCVIATMRTLKLISRFYGGLFLPNFLVTISALYMQYTYGPKAHEVMGVLFWYKVITLPLILYTAIHYKKQELYYYQNLGVSKLTLGICTSVFDFSLWLALSIIAFNHI
jgi:hypothetical protein